MTDDQDFFSSPFGNLKPRTWRSRRTGKLPDLAFGLRLRLNRSMRRLDQAIEAAPVRRVLLIGVEVPSRPDDIHQVIRALSRTRHDVSSVVVEMGDRGKFENINLALTRQPLEGFDWGIIVDDDITTPPGLLDRCIHVAEAADLRLFQPAHRFESYAAFELSHRYWNSLARITHFVEIGPLTGLHRSTFATLLPFPPTRMGYGLDLQWSELARANGWNIGFVDAVSIRHLRPVGRSYGRFDAVEEGRDFLRAHGITRRKEEVLTTVKVIRKL